MDLGLLDQAVKLLTVLCAVKSAPRFPGPRRKGLRSSLSVLSIHILAPMRGFSEAAVQILEWGWEAGAPLPEAGGGGHVCPLAQVSFSADAWHLSGITVCERLC